MWLLNTCTQTLRYFPSEGARPVYAILSHVWRDEEVSFTDIKDLERAQKLHGFAKVSHACAIALSDGYEWIWVDTCCIDKTSSAELSEAINSMFIWYRDAAVCYAYLYDASADHNPRSPHSSFRSSRWFTRGWTLQELIAPRRLVFYSQDWQQIGTKATLAGAIEELTHIGRAVLLHETHLDDISVAKRMSWAAKRETTRVEDRAYSLMGIFNVNMPTIYGEGEKAFIRLQHEIIRQSPDQSIFAWGVAHDHAVLEQNTTSFADGYEWTVEDRGLLASSPDMFADSAGIDALTLDTLASRLGLSIAVPEHAPTNYGIRMHLPLHTCPSSALCFAVLACEQDGDPLALLLRRTARRDNRYYVGVHSIYHSLRAPWQPHFRLFRLPADPARRKAFINHLAVTDLYIHSHNANPQRARRELEPWQRSLSSSDIAPRQFRFVFHGPLLTYLRNVHGFETRSPHTDPPEYECTPRSAWTRDPLDGSLTLILPPDAGHAVVLFRSPAGEAFAVAIGVQPRSAVWSQVLIRENAAGDDPTWAEPVLERIWREYGEASASGSMSGPDQWQAGARRFSSPKGRWMNIAFTQWVADFQVDGVADTRTYNVDVELGGVYADSKPVTSLQSAPQEPQLVDLIITGLQFLLRAYYNS